MEGLNVLPFTHCWNPDHSIPTVRPGNRSVNRYRASVCELNGPSSPNSDDKATCLKYKSEQDTPQLQKLQCLPSISGIKTKHLWFGVLSRSQPDSKLPLQGFFHITTFHEFQVQPNGLCLFLTILSSLASHIWYNLLTPLHLPLRIP